METDRLFELLARIQPLTANFKKALAKELRFVTYPKGHYLLQSLSIATHAYYLEKGFAVAYHYYDNKKIVTSFWQSGEIIVSPKSFFEQSRSNENIQLTIDSELHSISYQSVTKLFETLHITNILSQLILSRCHAKSEGRNIDLYNLDAWKRYLKLLKQYPGIEQHVSQDFIASYLHVTPQSLSRLKQKRR